MEKNITLVVVRHGKSAHNIGDENKHTFTGSGIDNGLSDEAKVETSSLVQKILAKRLPDAIFCSQLKRSKETAEIIATEIYKYKGTKLEIFEISELNEIDIGDYAGHTEEEVKSLFPESAQAFYKGEIEHWNFPKGENFHQVASRISIAMDKIEDHLKRGGTGLIVGHGMINRVLFYLSKPEDTDLWQPRSYEHDRIDILHKKPKGNI